MNFSRHLSSKNWIRLIPSEFGCSMLWFPVIAGEVDQSFRFRRLVLPVLSFLSLYALYQQIPFPRYLVVVLLLFSPTLSRFLVTQSSHCIFDLPFPSMFWASALLASFMLSPILSIWPARFSQLINNLFLKLLFTLRSYIVLLSAILTLMLLITKLFLC